MKNQNLIAGANSSSSSSSNTRNTGGNSNGDNNNADDDINDGNTGRNDIDNLRSDTGDVDVNAEDRDGEEEEGEEGSSRNKKKAAPVVVPKSVTGGEQHVKNLSLNSLEIVAQRDQPTFFVTLTTDANWREILECLHESQTAFDRPDIVTRVFHEKLKLFLHNLKHGVYNNHTKVDGKFEFEHDKDWKPVNYIMHVIEYQHRGLPHAHIVYRTVDAPRSPRRNDSADEKAAKQREIAQYVDGWTEADREDGKVIEHLPHICAYRIGQLNIAPSIVTTPDQEAQIILDDIVGEKQLHKCAIGEGLCKNTEDTNCKEGYEEFTVCNETTFDAHGYPVYKRPRVTDLKVVPHNPSMSLDWRAHICVESASRAKCCLYLYGYLFKGNKKARALARKMGRDDQDEVQMYLRGRYLCAMDASWRAYGFHTYPKTEPSVKVVAVKLKSRVIDLLTDGKVCDMYVYMESQTVPELANLKFAELFQQYHYKFKKPASNK